MYIQRECAFKTWSQPLPENNSPIHVPLSQERVVLVEVSQTHSVVKASISVCCGAEVRECEEDLNFTMKLDSHSCEGFT